MATPSVLTVPSMYGDGILYSGPSAYGSELVTNGDFSDGLNGWTLSTSPPTLNPDNTVTFDDSSEFIFRSWTDVVGTKYRIVFEGVGSIRYRTGFTGSDGTIIPINLPCEVDLLATANTNRIQIYGSLSQGNGILKSVSIKEITQGSDFDFTRATTGTRINEEGYIEDVPYNMITYSQDLSGGSGWIIQPTVTVTNNVEIAPDGTLTADKIVSSGGTAGVYKSVTNLDGVVTRSVYLKSVIGNVSVTIKDPVLTQTTKTLNLNETWQRYTLTEDNLQAYSQQGIWIDDIPASGIYMWGAQIVKGDQPKDYLPTTDRVNLPRLNYPVYGGCPSLLLEPQRTNSIIYSNDFLQSTWGGTQGLSVTLNNAVSPEGILNAATVTQDGTNVNPALATNASITIGQTYTFSMFVKNVNLNGFVRLSHVSSTVTGCWFNLDDGTIGTVNSQNATIKKYKNGWYRITNTFVATNSGTALLAFLGLSDTNGTTALSGSNQSVLVYGAQLELGSYATSLMNTSGSTVTRNEDKAENAGLGTTDTFNSSEGVLYAEIKALANDGTFREITLNDGTVNNVVELRYNNVDNQIQFIIRDGGSVTVNSQVVFSNVLEYNKIAFQYKANDFKMFANGRLVATDTELANLTSYNNHDLFIPYRSRMQMIGADQELQCTEHDITRFL